MSEMSDTNFTPNNLQSQNCLRCEPQDSSKKSKYFNDSLKSYSK